MLANTFYVPSDDVTKEKISYFLQMGTRRIPDMDSVGFKESWLRLMDCVGIGGSLAHSNGITMAESAINQTFTGLLSHDTLHHAWTIMKNIVRVLLLCVRSLLQWLYDNPSPDNGIAQCLAVCPRTYTTECDAGIHQGGAACVA